VINKETEKTAKPLVVDANNQIMGRLASNVAKALLKGEHVIIVNAEKTLISGNKRNIIDDHMKKLEITSKVNPVYTPKHSKQPDRMLRRTVRGMLPRRKSSGVDAFKRLRVFIGTPEEYSTFEKLTFENAKARRPLPLYMTLADISSRRGWSEE